MKKIIITPGQKKYILQNYTKISKNKVAKKIGCSRTPITKFYKENNLVVTKEQLEQFRINGLKEDRTTFTNKEDDFIKKNYLELSIKQIAFKLNRSSCGVLGRLKKFKLKVPKDILNSRKQKNQFKKGYKPPNKGKKQTEYMSKESIKKTKATRFKKGQKPHNAAADWHESTRKDKTVYGMIKVPGVKKMQYKHLWLWKDINGEIPQKHIICFKDGDTLNCVIENLECIPMKENLRRNSYNRLTNWDKEQAKRAIQNQRKNIKKWI